MTAGKDAPPDASTHNKAVKPEEEKPSNTKKGEESVEELSEEDQKLKEELEMLVERLTESQVELHQAALENLRTAIRTSTSSMTAVPKPLKFLRPHYETLVGVYDQWPESENKHLLADILSVLATARGTRETVKYRLLSGGTEFAAWGHEYVRHLALEIGEEYHERVDKDENVDDLLDLALQIVPFFLDHNAEADAVDLLLEVELVERLGDFVDAQTYQRVCRYLVSCVPYLESDDAQACLQTAYNVYTSFGELPQALVAAIRLDDEELVRNVVDSTSDISMKKQLALMIGRQRLWLPLDVDEEVGQCLTNTKLSEYFRYLAKELNLDPPRSPEDVFRIDSMMRGDLASIFVRGLVNCAFSNDKALSEETWVKASSKPVNMAAATTTLGMLHLWNYQDGLQELDKYMYSSEEHIKAGALLGVGVVSSGVHDETDAALGLLAEYTENPSIPLRSSSIIGLGFAYAGTSRSELNDLLEPLITNPNVPLQVAATAALALGLIYVGSANGGITTAIMDALHERASEMGDQWAVFMALGLALLYTGKPDDMEEAAEAARAIEHPISEVVDILLSMCAYCGSGNVLQIQRLLQEAATRPYEDESDEEDEVEENGPINGNADTNGSASERPVSDDRSESTEDGNKDKTEARYESARIKGLCTVGIAVVAMGEEIGHEMCLRHFEHLMHYGDSYIRQAVPLAMALISASDPQMKVYETLSRYTHDADLDVAINAIFAMGVVAAGTLNARVAQLLRQLARYYSRQPDALFMVRIAQGLVQLGKGTLTLHPFNTERQILSPVALGGLLTVSLALLNPKTFLINQNPSLLFFLTLGIQPRMLVTLSEDLEPIKVNVRVGQAVDVVGQAGRPKTITGWVTQTTPVLLSVGERAELEDEEYVPLSSAALEGLVILRKAPEAADS